MHKNKAGHPFLSIIFNSSLNLFFIKFSTGHSSHTPPTPQPLPPWIITKAVHMNHFTIMLFNANGIGHKQAK